MASDKIKGLTVKIGADTSDFIKGLKAVDKEINLTNKQANELQKGLQLEFDESRFVEAQRLVQKSLEETEEKAEAIRKQLKYLEDTGNVDTDGYKKLQTELYKAENNAVLLKKKLEDINNVKTTPITAKIKNFVANLKASTVAIAAIGTAIYKVTKNAAASGAYIQDLSDRLGVAAEEIQRYDYIALQSGVDTEQLVKSMAKARDAIGTALAGGSSTAVTALQSLFGDLKKIPSSTEEGFNAIIEQLSKVEDSTLQAYYANEIFGERLATNLIPLINNGAEKLNQLNSEFNNLGALTNEEVQRLADLDDLFNNVQKKIQNITIQLGVALAPVIELITDLLEPLLLVLQLIMELITPIIDGISWIVEKVNNIGLGLIGKGWLWGIEDTSTSSPSKQTTYSDTKNNYNIPTSNNNSNVSNYEDNSTYNIDIAMPETTGSLEYDAETLANEVIKKIAVAKQSSGRY